MAFAGSPYQDVTNSGSQTLVANTRTLLAIDAAGSGKFASVSTYTDGMSRWNSSSSKIQAHSVGETFGIRYTATIQPPTIALTVATPFSLHWEFDIGGSLGVFMDDWWDFPSINLLGLVSVTVASRRMDRTQAMFAGSTFQANGCAVYVTATAACTLVNSSLYIRTTGGSR